MKTFKTIEEWVKSKPTESETKRVLDFINKSQLSQARSEFYKKTQNLNRLKSFTKLTGKLNYEIPLSVKEKMKELEKDLLLSQPLLWPDGKKKVNRKKKTDVPPQEKLDLEGKV